MNAFSHCSRVSWPAGASGLLTSALFILVPCWFLIWIDP
ncbi:MAG: hypothetical protein EHM67_09425 [Hyphomicrobiaceae bacterium]|nr:MAG: hypothetical protein EHM67_09425 [Hyphomicrobiaceae bacterium]